MVQAGAMLYASTYHLVGFLPRAIYFHSKGTCRIVAMIFRIQFSTLNRRLCISGNKNIMMQAVSFAFVPNRE
jgi:hypothetical protein